MTKELEQMTRALGEDIVELEKALDAAREDARRLAAALRLAVAPDDHCRHVIIHARSMLSVGDVVDGALALHDVELAKGRLPL